MLSRKCGNYNMKDSLSFNTMEELQKAVSSQGEALTADIPNYTNSQPQIQISRVIEVKKQALNSAAL